MRVTVFGVRAYRIPSGSSTLTSGESLVMFPVGLKGLDFGDAGIGPMESVARALSSMR